MRLENIVDGIKKGKTSSLAKAITQVENRNMGGREIMKEIYRETGSSHIIGITGFPGVGKSSIISLITEIYRERGKTVGIIATDPSSPFTGGAFLGDRLRLGGYNSKSDLWNDAGVFYRSVSTGGKAGGIAQTTDDIINILDAGGFDKVIVETVGAGQSEVDIIEVVDTSVVILMPQIGDRIQFGKAGILEISDIFVINKTDLSGSLDAERNLKEMLYIEKEVEDFKGRSAGRGQEKKGHHEGGSKFTPPEIDGGEKGTDWDPPIIKTVAKQGCEEGSEELVQAIEKHREYIEREGQLKNIRKRRLEQELKSILFDLMEDYCRQQLEIGLDGWVEKIVKKEVDPYTAAERILSQTTKEET